MSVQNLLPSRDLWSFLLCFILISCFPGCILSQEVTLDSIQIFTTHEWFTSKPTVYFQCKGENKTVLPDVKKTDVLYSFNGEESWQPLTELQGTKCKRCGFYEKDTIKSDDVFDQWELCPSDFTPEGKYSHLKEKELNATFLCGGCSQVSAASKADSNSSQKEEKGMHPALLIVIVVVVSTVVILIAVAVYKYWQKKKRQQEQARFLKLFEDGDEIEDELGAAL